MSMSRWHRQQTGSLEIRTRRWNRFQPMAPPEQNHCLAVSASGTMRWSSLRRCSGVIRPICHPHSSYSDPISDAIDVVAVGIHCVGPGCAPAIRWKCPLTRANASEKLGKLAASQLISLNEAHIAPISKLYGSVANTYKAVPWHRHLVFSATTSRRQRSGTIATAGTPGVLGPVEWFCRSLRRASRSRCSSGVRPYWFSVPSSDVGASIGVRRALRLRRLALPHLV